MEPLQAFQVTEELPLVKELFLHQVHFFELLFLLDLLSDDGGLSLAPAHALLLKSDLLLFLEYLLDLFPFLAVVFILKLV